MRLPLRVNGVDVELELEHVERGVFDETAALLEQALATPLVKNREAIAAAFLHALRNSPGANASDLWHHVVYRVYCDIFRKHRPQDPKQSWVRASGEALECVVQELYAPVLAPGGIVIRALIGGAQKKQALTAMGLEKTVGSAKLDVALYKTLRSGESRIFGGVHVKASLAERVSDDVPASRAMMAKGYVSPIWTLDVKSFPPPGDLVNRGELGTPATRSEKRRYIEDHGDFDHCYSGNRRSVPSSPWRNAQQRSARTMGHAGW